MSNNDNPSAQQRIWAAAYRLMLAKGYNATTYSHISEESGCARTLVQYHVPAKAQLAIGLTHDLVGHLEHCMAASKVGSPNGPEYIFQVTQAYYEFLLQEEFLPFTRDILGQRDVLSQVMAMELDWYLQLRNISKPSQSGLDRAIVSVGGAHELLYWRLSEGERPEAAVLARHMVLGTSAGKWADSVAATALNADELRQVVACAHHRLLTEPVAPRRATAPEPARA